MTIIIMRIINENSEKKKVWIVKKNLNSEEQKYKVLSLSMNSDFCLQTENNYSDINVILRQKSELWKKKSEFTVRIQIFFLINMIFIS